jgi:hypothetical protein
VEGAEHTCTRMGRRMIDRFGILSQRSRQSPEFE